MPTCSPLRRSLAACLLGSLGVLALAAAPLQAQTVLASGDVAVATTTGIYVVEQGQRAVRVTTGQTLVHPSIEWVRGTDDFYLTSGNELFLVHLTGLTVGSATVQTLATLPVGTDLRDLDVDMSTGDLWVLDVTSNAALRFDAPVLAGATPSFTLPLAPDARALCVDSAHHPMTLQYATAHGLMRQGLHGPAELAHAFQFGEEAGVDMNFRAQRTGAYFTDTASHTVLIDQWGSTSFAAKLQTAVDRCVDRPYDIEWWPSQGSKAYVVGESVVSSCFPSGPSDFGQLQVVAFNPGGGATGPFPTPPAAVLISEPTGASGIFGSQPDLAVLGDVSYAGSYGESCTATTGETPTLVPAWKSNHGWPDLANQDFRLELRQGPPLRPVFVGLAMHPTSFVTGGCTQLVATSNWKYLGLSSAAGAMNIAAGIPNNPGLAGTDLYGQAVVFDVDVRPVFTNGLRFHFE